MNIFSVSSIFTDLNSTTSHHLFLSALSCTAVRTPVLFRDEKQDWALKVRTQAADEGHTDLPLNNAGQERAVNKAVVADSEASTVIIKLPIIAGITIGVDPNLAG